MRAKPPLPAVSGLFGRPTLINNVLTFAAIPYILDKGGAAYARFWHGPFARHAADPARRQYLRGGLIETAFGVACARSIEDFGGGTASGRPVRAVQLGGPLGAYLAEKFDVPLDYEALRRPGAHARAWRHRRFRRHRGHGAAWRVSPSSSAPLESCGKCTPCRVGATRGAEAIDKIIAGREARRISR